MAVLPVRSVALTGILSAVVIVLGITHLGLIPWFSGASVTIMHVPAILGGILGGPVVGLIVGACFGLLSLIQSAIGPTGPLDPLFTNPLISILPRLCIGPVAALVYRLVAGKQGHASSVPRETLALVSGSVIGSLTNTVLVLSALFFFAHASVQAFLPSWTAIGALVLINGLPEAVAASLIVVAVVLAWRRIPGVTRKARISEDEGL